MPKEVLEMDEVIRCRTRAYVRSERAQEHEPA